VILQYNPNAWSCLPTAAAMVFGVFKWAVLEYIGHDGSEIKYADLKDPNGRRGFHMQEIIDVATFYGFYVTPIEAIPCSTPGPESLTFEVDFKISPAERLDRYMSGTSGIITGMVNGVGHAVAWDGAKCYDPRGRICDLDDLRMDIDCYWLFQMIATAQ
jgi:hypothetical protein